MAATTGTFSALVTADSRRAIKRNPGGRSGGLAMLNEPVEGGNASPVVAPDVRTKTRDDFGVTTVVAGNGV